MAESGGKVIAMLLRATVSFSQANWIDPNLAQQNMPFYRILLDRTLELFHLSFQHPSF
jgi:hypothetical protein